MSRHKDAVATAHFGKALTRLHRKAGSPSFSTIERALVEVLGPTAPVAETLRGYHVGKVDPASVHIDVAVGLANYYGVPVDQLHASFGPRFTRGHALLQTVWAARDSNPEPADSVPVAAAAAA